MATRRPALWRPVSLGLALAGALALAALASLTPAPRGADAPADAFSAGRAMADVRRIARQPHPMGSPANGEVRRYLVERMTAMGLSPSVWRGSASEQPRVPNGYAPGGRVENVVGVLPGTDPDAPAVLVMAHYDSVLNSPGAADDAAGVAAALEAVRAIQVRGPIRRDLVVLFTDGEEAGLLGARAFFAGDPLAERIGAVVNLEARGAGGRAIMFETGPDNGALIDLFARHAHGPTSNALAVFLYKLLPNDTDFTLPREKGLPGLNFAIVGRAIHYHAASATPENLEQGALQSLGDQALAALDPLVRAERLPAKAPDKTYASVFGRVVLGYPAWAGWVVIALALGLATWAAVGVRLKGQLRPLDVARGFGAALGATAAGAGLLWLAGLVAGAGPSVGDATPARAVLAQAPLFEAVLALVGLAALALGAWLCGKRRAAAFGWFCAPVIAAFALQVAAPTAAFFVAWPLLAAAVGLVLDGRATLWSLPLKLLVALVAAAWVLELGHLLYVTMGSQQPALLAVLVLLTGTAVLPLLRGVAGTPGVVAAALLAAVGFGGAVYVRAQDPFSAATPAPVQAIYLVDGDEAHRISGVRPLDPWSRAALNADAAAISEAPVPALGWTFPAYSAPTAPIRALPAQMILTRPSGEAPELAVIPPAGAVELRLTLTSAADLSVRLPDGGVLKAPAGKPAHIRWIPGGQPLVVRLEAAPGAKVSATAAAITYAWPQAAEPLPPMPKNRMAWGLSGATVVVARDELDLTGPKR